MNTKLMPCNRTRSTYVKVVLFACLSYVSYPSEASVAGAEEVRFDLVIANGRIMDPDSGLDGIAYIGVSDGIVKRISKEKMYGERVIDAKGLVVAPGFIDLHAHGQNPTAQGLQALDGVTTALELESGAFPLGPFYRQLEGRSRINFGASVSHRGIRIKIKTGIDSSKPGVDHRELLRRKDGWAEATITESELEQGLRLFRDEIADGGLGLGLLAEYTPGANRREVYLFMKEAADLGVPVFAHVRAAREPGIGDLFEMVQEVIANAAVSGGALHICHVTSKGLSDTALILDAIANAQKNGLDITTEAYPYTAGSTSIGSALFNEGWQERWDATYKDIEWPSTGERLTKESFTLHRRKTPEANIFFHMIPQQAMDIAITSPVVMIASDGMPFTGGSGHPRGAGTFSRVLGLYVREKEAISLMDALGKMTIMPARRLGAVAPAMRRKGRLQEGADADIVIFDPEIIIDRATYRDPMRPSKGIVYVLVAGVEVVADSVLQDVYPGEAIRGAASR